MKCNVSDKQYIDRTAAIMTAMDYDGNGDAQDASQDIASALGCIPVADVAPVVHARWEYDDPSGDNWFNGSYWCSNCREREAFKRNFCPNCGARMGVQDGA